MKHLKKMTWTALICFSAGAVHAGAPEAVAERSETFEAAFNSGDAAGVAAHYSEDAIIMPPDMARIDGRDGIQGVWQGFIDAGATDLDLVTIEVDDFGDTANELGSFTLNVPDGNGGTVQVAGKYIVVWKRGGDDQWYLQWDIWNGNP